MWFGLTVMLLLVLGLIIWLVYVMRSKEKS